MKSKNSIKHKIKASELPSIISNTSKIKPSILRLVQLYVFALMIRKYSKTLKNIADTVGEQLYSFSRMLSHELLGQELNLTINRKTRQIIAAYINKHGKISVEIIIDATHLERSSKKAENVALYHSNGKKIIGHRITNIGMLLDGTLYIPLAALSHRSRPFAKKLGLSYLTEGMMVNQWLREHMDGVIGIFKFTPIKPSDITFLMDAGYDKANIQNAVLKTGCHFVMMIKSNRLINSTQVRKFFTKNRHLSWQSVYFNREDANGKQKRRKFRIRTAHNVNLQGVGKVTVVCSEKATGSSKKLTRRYLVSSRANSEGRGILDLYSRRWKIETWHKDMKQNYGINDCSASKFVSIENHVKLCLIAYLFHLQNLRTLPAKGTRIEDYLRYTEQQQTRTKLRLINGGKVVKDEIAEKHDAIFAKVG